MHAHARAFFVLAVFAASAMFGVVAKAAVTPKPVPVIDQTEVAIATVEQLKERQPALVMVPALKDLEAKARRARNWSFGRSPAPSALPVYLVKDAETVRAFIAFDPRNGCDLDIIQWGTMLFHDVCHGALYDFAGQHVGGPSPFTLDELVITVRNGVVFASVRDVIPGRLIYPQRAP